MFFAFALLGILAIVTAVKGNQNDVATQIEKDFTASGTGPSFWVWIGAIIVLGVIGRATGATGAVRLFIALLIVVYLVANKGIFASFQSALTKANAPVATAVDASGASVAATSAPNLGSGTAIPGVATSGPAQAAGAVATSNPLQGATSAAQSIGGAALSLGELGAMFGL